MKNRAISEFITLSCALIVTLLAGTGCSSFTTSTPTNETRPAQSTPTPNAEISAIADEAYGVEQQLLSLVKPYLADKARDVTSDQAWAPAMRSQLARLDAIRNRVRALNLPDKAEYTTFAEWLAQLAAAHEAFVEGIVAHDDSRITNARSLYHDAAANKAELETLTFYDPLPAPYTGRKSPSGLSVGDCPARFSGSNAGGLYSAVLLVLCDSGKASGRVTNVFQAPILYGSYPGEPYFAGLAEQSCAGSHGTYFFPTANSWAELDRTVTCVEALAP